MLEAECSCRVDVDERDLSGCIDSLWEVVIAVVHIGHCTALRHIGIILEGNV
jgi:hypothetical protein